MKLVLIAVLVAVLATTAYAATVTECGVLNDSDTYTLANNINSTATCLVIKNSSITLDCAGYLINYSQGLPGYGIYSNSTTYLTIQNCNIWQESASLNTTHGINLTNVSHGGILNNNITVRSTTSIGIFLANVTNETIRNNIVTTGGTGTTKHAISIIGFNNSVIRNNSLTASGASFSQNGLLIHGGYQSMIVDNRIFANGTSSVYAMRLLFASSYNLVANNSMYANGTSGAIGVEINAGNGNNVTGNDLLILGPFSEFGIMAQSSAHNNTIRGNTVLVRFGTGIYFGGPATGNTAQGNTIEVNGTSDNVGMYFSTAHNNTFTANNVTVNGVTIRNYGIRSVQGRQNNVTGNQVLTNGTFNNQGLRIESTADNNTFDGNNVTTGGVGSYGVLIVDSNGSIINNTVLADAADWIYTGPVTTSIFQNTTLSTSGNKLRLTPQATLTTEVNASRSSISISAAGIYLNSSNLTFFNTSARLTQAGTFTNPTIRYDPTDTGTFIDCPGSICTLISNAAGIVTFDVTHFTNYTVTEGFIPPAPEFGTWMMMLLALGLVAGGVMRVRRRAHRA